MRRVIPNLLDDIATIADDPGSTTRYGADLLGRILGHAIKADGYVTGIMVAVLPAINHFTVSQQCMVRAEITDVLNGR